MKNRKATVMLMLMASGALSSFAYPAFASGANDGIDTPDTANLIAGLGASAIPGTQLAKIRGGSGTVAAVNIGVDGGNSANNSVTGIISNVDSVNNNVGLTTVQQNTGNNVLMQSSTTLNITMH
jgi:hypothetical protein